MSAADLRNIVRVDNFSRHLIKLGKDIQSDHDILTEELIPPVKSRGDPSSADQRPTHSMSEDDQQMQTNQYPSTKQLIDYKQHIQTANNRRLHREKLAKIAEERRNQEQVLGVNIPYGAEEQQTRGDGLNSPQIVPDEESSKSLQKPVAKSREDEELLKDEAYFGSSKRRTTDRNKNKMTTVGLDMAYMTSRRLTNPRLSMGNIDGTAFSPMGHIVCKLCGQVIENDTNRSSADLQQAQGKTNDFCLWHRSSAIENPSVLNFSCNDGTTARSSTVCGNRQCHRRWLVWISIGRLRFSRDALVANGWSDTTWYIDQSIPSSSFSAHRQWQSCHWREAIQNSTSNRRRWWKSIQAIQNTTDVWIGCLRSNTWARNTPLVIITKLNVADNQGAKQFTEG